MVFCCNRRWLDCEERAGVRRVRPARGPSAAMERSVSVGENDGEGRTFAELLDHLWRTVHPLGKPYTYEQVAAGVAEAGGEISVAYLWQLRKGERTNPTLQHIQALAKFFGVPAAYFLDPEEEQRINQHLDVLAAMRDANVRNIALRAHGLGERELAALSAMVTSLREARGLKDSDDKPPADGDDG